MSKCERDQALSLSKGIAMFLVVLGHSIVGNIRETNIFWSYIYDFIYSFHMFYFFLMSGYLFQLNYDKYSLNKKQVIRNKIVQLLVPYLCITIIEYIMILIFTVFNEIWVIDKFGQLLNLPDFTLGRFVKALIFNIDHFDTHLWFIYVLFFIFLINLIIPKKLIVHFFVISLSMIFFRSYLFVFGNLFVTVVKFMVPFILGRILCTKNLLTRIKTFKFKSHIITATIWLFAVIVINLVVDKLQMIESSWILQGFIQEIQYISGFFGSLMLYSLGCIVCRYTKISSIINVINSYNYDIYILHQPFITAGVSIILLKTTGIPLIAITVSTCAGVVASIVISKYLLRKIPIASKLLLGRN